MILVMKKNTAPNSILDIIIKIENRNIKVKLASLKNEVALICTGKNLSEIDPSFVKALSNDIAEIKNISTPYKLVSRDYEFLDTIVDIDGVKIGGGDDVVIIAGPCSVESKEQIKEVAHFVKENNAKILRGGVFKPRTSPYDFQGLGKDGLKYIKEASEETGLKMVCEILDIRDVEFMKDYVDIFQIGTRNMYNYPLLREMGKVNKPVILKRGFSATVDEWLMSAEYIVIEGNRNVILCERGIRTFNTYTRNTLDISVIPYIKSVSHLPIIVDPSHSAGKSYLVPTLAKASIVAGVDGVMLEVHKYPEDSFSDSEQALSFEQFSELSKSIDTILKVVKKNKN